MNLHRILLTVSLTLLATACDDNVARDAAAVTDEAGRGLGKADVQLEGFCGDVEGQGLSCGGPAPVGNCWCDAACEQYGDCCVDSFDACGVGEPQPAVSQCLADSHCDGRLVSALEGGYEPDAVAHAGAAHVGALMCH